MAQSAGVRFEPARGASSHSRFQPGRDPTGRFHPTEIGYYIPDVTANTDPRCVTVNGERSCKTVIQTNNVNYDDRGYLYAVDRANTGLHILRLTGSARAIAGLPGE